MPLLDGLSAQQPRQQFKCSDLFRQHPALVEEVNACRAAGYSWKQIADQISLDYQIRVHASGLSDFMRSSR